MKRAILISVLWCFLLHRPALLSFGKAIPGSEQGDTLRGHWSTWLLSQDTWPIESVMCNWPEGVHLLPLPPLSLWMLSPITSLLGAAYALSIFVFLHSILCVIGGFVLGKTLDFSARISLSLGLLLSATPMLGETLSNGVFEYQTLGWVPLFFASLIHTCKGNLLFAPISAFLYSILALECGYYGSAAALGAIFVVISHTRSWRGCAAAALSAGILSALAYGIYQFISPTLSKLSSGEMQAGGDFRVVMGKAEVLALLPGINPPPPPPGMPDPFVSAPPLLLWALFLCAIIFSWRRSYWSSILMIAYLGIAMQSPIMDWWTNNPLGSFVQNLRRFVAPMTLMMLVSIAYGWQSWSHHKNLAKRPYLFSVFILILLLWSAKDLLLRYPLLWLPQKPLIAQTIDRDPSPGAVLVFPQEQAGRKTSSHQYLRNNTSFSNPQARLWFQTLINREMRHHTKLATLVPKKGRRWKLDGNQLDRLEVELLKQKGLRYVILDHTQLSTQDLQKTQGLFSQMGYGCTTFAEWGGLDLCLLEQR